MSEPEKTGYRSPLRANQSERTRELIVEAIASQLVEHGLSDFSVNEIAKRAGVSVRTVYRYFPTREDLLRAAEEDWKKREPEIPLPEHVDQLPQVIEVMFRFFEQNRDLIEARFLTTLGQQVLDRMKKQRNEWSAMLTRRAAPHLSDAEVRLRAAILRVLVGSTSWRSLTRDAGLTLAEATEATQWAVRAMTKELAADEARAKKRRAGR